MKQGFTANVAVVAPTLPAGWAEGYPTNGDPLVPTPPTQPGAFWYHMMGTSLERVILGAGLTPDPENFDLLKDAINAIVAAAGLHPLPQKYISGCEISNNAADAAHDIDFAVGTAKSSDGTYDIAVTSAIGKRLDAVWAAGGTPGAATGGRASGVSLAAGWYRTFLISKPDGTVGAGFDTSATAANLLADATGYTKYRQNGWILYTGSTVVKFYQFGDEFIWDVPAVDVNAVAGSSAGVAVTLTAPPGTAARFTANCYSGSGTQYILFTETSQTNTAVAAGQFDLISNFSDYAQSAEFVRRVDTSSQIRQRATGASTGYSIFTKGWTDLRGK